MGKTGLEESWLLGGILLVGVMIAVPLPASGQNCVADPCAQGCPTHPCCSDPMDICCGNPDFCTTGLQSIDPLNSECRDASTSSLTEFPIYLDELDEFPGPPDMPPRSVDFYDNSLPLVSRQGAGFGSPMPQLSVPSEHKFVDLVFGRPLVQAIDFELPFGTATFRHVRTFGKSLPSVFGWASTGDVSWWAWNGSRWMMGENPILLIDAQMDISIGAGFYRTFQQRRCYLIPDAHHAIPFLHEQNSGGWAYVAPPWFDAVLDHNGTMDSNGDWVTQPTEFYVWLNRNSIKYTFEAHYTDHVNANGVIDHDPPPDGDGAPFYGLLKEISDRQGNRVVMEYCGVQEFYSEGCYQPLLRYLTCNQKGQLKRVKLIPPEESTPAWTLVYYHQGISCPFTTCFEQQSAITPHHVRSIFVYKEDVSELDEFDCLTLPIEEFCRPNPVPPQGSSEYVSAKLPEWDNPKYVGVPNDWIIQAEYTYSNASWYTQPDFVSDDVVGGDDSASSWLGLLIRSVVRRRVEESTSSGFRETTTLYRYHESECGDIGSDCGSTAGQTPALSMIIESSTVDETLSSVVDSSESTICDEAIGTNGPSSTYLLKPDDKDKLCMRDPKTGVHSVKTLENLATHYFSYLPDQWSGSPYDEIVDDFGAGAAATLQYLGGAVRGWTSRSGSADADGTFDLYLLRIQGPEGEEPECDYPLNVDASVAEQRYPYYLTDYGGCSVLMPPTSTRFVSVVDRHNLDGEPATRRVVDMNAQGFILRDRTFEFNTNGTTTVQQQGYAEERKYNTAGRITEIRTEGWSSEENENYRDIEGLIYFFEYGSNGVGELSAEGVMVGTAGTKYYTATYERETNIDVSSLPAHMQSLFGRKELLTKVTQYRTPVTSSGLASATDVEVTSISYDFGTTPATNPPVLFEEQVTNIGSFTSNGVPIWAIERKKYDDAGNLIWRGIGRFATTNGEPERPTNDELLEFFVDRSMYNSNGQIVRSVLDIDTTGAPSEFQRKADPLLTPLELEATYSYDVYGRPLLINKPTGRSDVFIYDIDSATTSGILETWKYEDVLLGSGGGNFAVTKPVTIIQTTPQGRLHATITANLLSVDSTPDGDESYDVITVARMQYDEFGRPVGVKAPSDPDTPDDALESKITYDAFGQVGRSQGPDGTVTRTTRGTRGRVQKIYRGTDDIHPYWRTAVYCDPVDPECEYPNGYPDNMVLVEKRFYGVGTTNAGRVREVREYNQKPTNQYFFTDPADPEYPLNDEDSNGLPTVFEYDCRMRQVVAESQDESGSPQYRTFTWYDHLDRVRFVAEYGPNDGPPSTLDPTFQCYLMANGGFGDTQPEPDVPIAADILGATPAPLSLRETLYNAAGQIAEERDYQVSPATPVKYTATFYEFDGRSLTVSQQSPGGGTIRSLYDALGRLAVQRTTVFGTEVRRLENIYDAVGNLTQETTYERMALATGVNLSGSNAIVRYRHNWYDDGRRLIATADYGTNNSSDIYANAAAPTYNGGSPPATVTSLGDALVTLYEYDEAGRQYRVTDSGGIVTETEYDALGRVLLVTENADGAAADQRHTAYQYEAKTGRLTRVAAVKPSHFGGSPSYDSVNFGASDGSVQVTRYDYNGPVVNVASNGAYVHVSTNGAWISAIHYPDEVTGAPEAESSLQFSYRHDGQVVQRIDARGVELVYRYDARDRLESIELGSVTSTGFDVDTTAFKLVYAYEPTGELAAATVKNRDGQTLNTIDFDYGGFRQVEGVTQTVTGGSARFTDYNWAIKPNRYRLLNMAYPIGGGTTIKFEYGDDILNPTDQPIDNELDRMTAIQASGGAYYVRYRYMGDGRMVGKTLGQVYQDYDGGIVSGGNVTGLDRFGRITDITYQTSSDQLLAYAYGYDRRGNRTFARVENPTEDDSSWLYGYDDLSRLIRASKGILNSAGDALTGAAETLLWDLDNLGNFSGDSSQQASFHRFTDLDADGVVDAGEATLEAAHHDTNQANEIERLLGVDIDSNATTTGFAYDAADNLLFDGERFYTYDAFNRLVRVHEPGSLSVGTSGLQGTAGRAIVEFAYDALGRKIRTTLRPGTAASYTTEHVYGSGAEVLAEYDVTQSAAGTLLRWFIHGEMFPDPLVMVDLTNAGMEAAGVDENFYYLTDALGSVGALADDYGDVVERYAYDPYGATPVLDANGNPAQAAIGGVAKPVDELASIFYHDHDGDGDIDGADEDDLLACATNGFDIHCVYHHDRDGDRVVDIIDLGVFYGFEDFNTSGTTAPTIFGRPPPNSFDWDGDGRIDLYDYAAFSICTGVSIATNSQPCAAIFDSDADQNITTNDLAAMVAAQTAPGTPTWQTLINASQYGNPFAYTGQRYDPITGLYHFWARTYDPVTSRWLQRDMMGPLAALDIMLGSGGGTPYVLPSYVLGSSEFANGFNLFAYVASNPITRFDPLGLYDEDIDDLTADLTGHKISTLGYLSEASTYALVGSGVALDIAGSLLGLDLLVAAGNIFSGEGTFSDFVTAAAYAVPLGGVTAKALWKAAKWSRKFKKVSRSPQAFTMSLRVLQKICFTRGTLVLMADGTTKAVETIEKGDCVSCDYNPTDNDGPESCEVTQLFTNTTSRFVQIDLEDEGEVFTIEATPEHPFYVSEIDQYVPAYRLTSARGLRSSTGLTTRVQTCEVQSGNVQVFNIEVAGAHNYFVSAPNGGPTVLVHNACVTPGPKAWKKLAKTNRAKGKRLNAGEFRTRFHRVKDNAGLGPADHILKVDDETGDVLANFPDSDIPEYLGNLFEDF